MRDIPSIPSPRACHSEPILTTCKDDATTSSSLLVAMGVVVVVIDPSSVNCISTNFMVLSDVVETPSCFDTTPTKPMIPFPSVWGMTCSHWGDDPARPVVSAALTVLRDLPLTAFLMVRIPLLDGLEATTLRPPAETVQRRSWFGAVGAVSHSKAPVSTLHALKTPL